MPDPSDVLILGDGPTGLSAALLLAKNDQEVDVLGGDETAMHKAYLYNYLGIEAESGSKTMETARGQVDSFGTRRHADKAKNVEADDEGFRVTGESDTEYRGRYLVLATGRDTSLASQLGLEQEDGVVRVDLNGRTSKQNVYAGGWLVRGKLIQAAISVGDGAAIALHILSQEHGKPFHDFDTKPHPEQSAGRTS